MDIHPAFNALVEKFQRKEIHAAHSGRELMHALNLLVVEGQASSWSEVQAELDLALEKLLAHMLAYAPPMNVLHSFLVSIDAVRAAKGSLDNLRSAVSSLAKQYQVWSDDARTKIAEITYHLIDEGSTIFTFTLSETVLLALTNAWESGKRFHVHVTESRPNKDGILTAERLAGLGIPVEISIDACISDLMRESDLMIGGAEAVMMDGSAVCKTGTYLAALNARELGVPFYILADTMKFDVSSMHGIQVRFDPIVREDFPGLASEEHIQIAGHLFDRTPARLIRSIVTERGVLPPVACIEIMRHMPVSVELLTRLRAMESWQHVGQ